MLLNGFLLLTIIPAVLVMLAGLWIMPWVNKRLQSRRWLLFLIVIAIILLIPIAAYARHFRTGQEGLLLLLILPALEGVLALILINWRSIYVLWQKEKAILSALLLALVLLVVGIALGDPFLPLAITILPIFSAVLWAAGQRLNTRGLVTLSVVVLGWLLLEALGVSGSRLVIAATWSRAVHTIARLVSVILAFALTALLIYKGKWTENRHQTLLHLILAGLLVLGLNAIVVRSGILIKATGRAAEDHLPFAEVLVAIIGGMVLTGAMQGRRRLAGLAFVTLVPALIAGSYALGWQFDPQAITGDRADQLTQAIVRYHTDIGVYPPSLTALTPNYLPFILGPLTGRDQVWCYEGGQDYYRLGYVYYQRYYGPTFPDPYYEIKIHSSAGQLPDGSWICDDELRRVEITGGL